MTVLSVHLQLSRCLGVNLSRHQSRVQVAESVLPEREKRESASPDAAQIDSIDGIHVRGQTALDLASAMIAASK